MTASSSPQLIGGTYTWPISAAEMPHIGIERLGASYRKKHRTQHQKAVPGMSHEQHEAIIRVDRQQDVGLPRDPPDAEYRQDREPDDHDRPEQPAESRRPAAL